MKKTFRLFAIATSITLFSGCGQVDPGELGVRVDMGVMDKSPLRPGWFLWNPFTQKVVTYSVKQESVDGTASPLTADQQPITISYKVLYRIPEDKVTDLYSKYEGDPYKSLVEPRVQEAFRQVVSQVKADQATKNIDGIKNQVLAQVQKDMAGLIMVTDTPITHIELPKILQDAIATKQVAEQTALQKQYELEKEKKQAEITVVGAEAQARSTLVNAESEAKAIKIKSDALAQSPQLVEYTKAQKWDGHLPETMVTTGEKSAGMFMQIQAGNKPQKSAE